MTDKPEEARYTKAYEAIQDRMSGDPRHPNLGWQSAVHADDDGFDEVAAKRRALNKDYLGLAFVEYLELLDALIRRERIEKGGGTSSDYPPVLQRLGVTAAMWEQTVKVTSRRFARELDIMAMMFTEARQLG